MHADGKLIKLNQRLRCWGNRQLTGVKLLQQILLGAGVSGVFYNDDQRHRRHRFRPAPGPLQCGGLNRRASII